jgi:DNA-binding transcriptional LysR family regulator
MAGMSNLRFSVRQIEAFICVAECNSFTAAANRLSLTTPSISSLIAELESTIGTRLFERSTRRVVLNDAGRLFLPSALAFSRNLRNVELVAETLSAQSNGVVRVAAPMVMASAILPKMVAEFQAQNPESEIVIIDTPVEWLGERVASGEVDLAVGPDRPADVSISAEKLSPSKWVAWLSPKHPLAAKPILRWSDLKGERFHTGGHDHERIVEQALEGRPEEERVIPGQVYDYISTALGIASANLGVTLCPSYVAPLAHALNLEMRRLIEPEFTRHIVLYSSATRPKSEAMEKFSELLRIRFAEIEDSLNPLETADELN